MSTLEATEQNRSRSAENLKTLESILFRTLDVHPDIITDNLSYQDISSWDSSGHLSLMLAMEKAFSTKISGRLVSKLTSVRALKDFVSNLETAESYQLPNREPETTNPAPRVFRGLVGISVDRSAITEIDPDGGTLRYRGYSVAELATRSSYEETSFLLLHGRLPEAAELETFAQSLRRRRAIPASVVDLLSTMTAGPPFLALQAAVALLGAAAEDDADAGISLLAQVPTIIGTLHRLRTGQAIPDSADKYGHAENLLHLLSGAAPDPLRARALEETLILLADHGSSASTFTARVVTSTTAGLHAAVSGAIGAFSGPLHGGAVNEVMTMVEEIGSPDAAARFVRDRLERKAVIYGFGHRVYRTADPRSQHLRAIAWRLGRDERTARTLEILDAVASALAEYCRLGMDINVDFYASAVFEALQIPRDLFGPVFAAARMAGLIAHIREQRANNVLIRPQLLYVGEPKRSYRCQAPS